jgi:hypothetical protein
LRNGTNTVAHVAEHAVGVHVSVRRRRCPPPEGQHAVFTCDTRVKTFPHPAWSLRCSVRVVFVCAHAFRTMKTTVVTIEWVYAVGLELGLGGAAAAACSGAAACALLLRNTTPMRCARAERSSSAARALRCVLQRCCYDTLLRMLPLGCLAAATCCVMCHGHGRGPSCASVHVPRYGICSV